MIMYAVIAIVVLVLIFLIVRNINLPKIIEQRREQAKEAEDRRDERRDERKEDIEARRERWKNRTPIFRRKRDPDEVKK